MSKYLNMDLAITADSQENYLQRVGAIPVLSAEDERALAVRFQEENDLDAARQLVMSNLRFVAHIARGYSGYGLPVADLIQEGNVGLMKAVKRYDYKMNVRLVSYAVHWIRAEIHEFILRNWRIVKVATTKAQRKLFFNLRSNKKRLGWFSQDEVNTVANDLGVTPADVMEMEKRMSSHDASFDLQGSDDDESYRNPAPAAYLEDANADPFAQLESEDWDAHNSDRLNTALLSLDDRSRDILRQRWLSEDKSTLQVLAAHYQVSAERIRQLEKNAMNKLRAAMVA